MSWYTAHILSIITFLPLAGAVVIAFLGRGTRVVSPLGRARIFVAHLPDHGLPLYTV